jgi:hypothetical protein
MTLALQIAKRIEMSGTGNYHLAADIVDLCAAEADTWTNRSDDATRIPDVLGDAVRELRELGNRPDES